MMSCNETKQADGHYIESHGNFSFYSGIDTLETINIAKYEIDLDFDNKIDTIFLENLKGFVGDPQLYTILRIKLGNSNEYIFKNIGGELIDKQTSLKLSNRIQSDKLYIPNQVNEISYLFVWDYQYPDCTALLNIFTVDNAGIKQVYSDDFYAHEILDIDNNGVLEIIGKETCEADTYFNDSLNATISGYHPYLVLRLDSVLTIDTALTIKYNADNYIFEGFEATYDITIASPRNSEKPYRIK
jgi:hypothetical protein